MLRIGLFGAGRVASALAPALALAGHEVVFVASRSAASSGALAARVPGCRVLAPGEALPAADLYLLAVTDAAVPVLLAATDWPAGAVVAHTAGTLPLSAITSRPELHGGVLYPLQTFTPGRVIDWQTVPLFVEAADAATEALLLGVARSLGPQVRLLASAQRLQLHLGAVWTSNFPNHLLGIAQTVLAEAGLPFELLHPLLRETVDKVLAAPTAFAVQTGPAVRGDQPTLAAHEAALAAHPGWQALYHQLSASIAAQAGPPPSP